MKSPNPCEKFQSHPEHDTVCFWCGWDEVPHLVPERQAFETTYWETLLSATDGVTDDQIEGY